MLREVAMPSILVELGYISNAVDERYMKTESGQRSLANSVYIAFNEYKREYDKKSHVFTNPNRQTATTSSPTPTVERDGASEYRVQFLTASGKLSNNSPQLKGLKPVDFYVEGSTYKYTYGSTSNLNEINNTLKTVRAKFKDAFVVEFRNGVRVR